MTLDEHFVETPPSDDDKGDNYVWVCPKYYIASDTNMYSILCKHIRCVSDDCPYDDKEYVRIGDEFHPIRLIL